MKHDPVYIIDIDDKDSHHWAFIQIEDCEFKKASWSWHN